MLKEGFLAFKVNSLYSINSLERLSEILGAHELQPVADETIALQSGDDVDLHNERDGVDDSISCLPNPPNLEE
jgi:hypothetical protein